MMADSAVCEACGVDVRDESSFCYNCGKRVVFEPDDVSAAVADEVEGIAQRSPEKVAAAPTPNSKPPLRSAASLRKQRRAISREPVEIRWERPPGLGIGFILTAILLTAVAFVLMGIALYLR